MCLGQQAPSLSYRHIRVGRRISSVIGSYTRACRCMLDTSIPGQAKRTEKLRAWIARHTGDADAELLEEMTE